MNIDNNKLGIEYSKIKSYLQYYDTYGVPIVEEYSRDLDKKVSDITDYLNQCRTFNLDFDVPSLQRIVIDLSSTIYYTSSRLEQIEILADMAKLSYKGKYNEAYISRQGASKQEDRKYTSDQLKALADQDSLEEELVYFIYSHCVDIIQAKVAAANEMLKACSKSLSAAIEEMKLTGLSKEA